VSSRPRRTVFARATAIAAVTGTVLLAVAGGASATVKAGKPSVTAVSAASGPSTGGTRVTVKGTNLSHVTAVTFDGRKGTNIKVSATHKSLLVTTPTHDAGQVHVRVKTTADTSGLGNKDLFTYRTYASLAAGYLHTCAVSGGEVRCWGFNESGQLGNNTTTDAETPVVVKGLTHVVSVSAGGNPGTDVSQSCALVDDGTVRCWGDNTYGQLGTGTTVSSHVPVKVKGLSKVVAIAVGGGDHVCALIADGTARCWGYNGAGELGNGTTTNAQVPVKVSRLTHAIAMAINNGYSCALVVDGTVRCWGYNANGQLGNGTTAQALKPVQVHGVTRASGLSAGWLTACAVVFRGAVRCWGNGDNGDLGNGGTSDSHTASLVAGLTGATAVSSGSHHSCALVRGHVFCWGRNIEGEIGDGIATPSPRLTPTGVARLGTTSSVSTGALHTCAQLTTGSVRCWGSNAHGELGNGTTNDSPLPVPVSG
jgi:alpha-tubulin suppressor-like RCC1 family protein